MLEVLLWTSWLQGLTRTFKARARKRTCVCLYAEDSRACLLEAGIKCVNWCWHSVISTQSSSNWARHTRHSWVHATPPKDSKARPGSLCSGFRLIRWVMTAHSSGPPWPDNKQGPPLLLPTPVAAEFHQLSWQPVGHRHRSPRVWLNGLCAFGASSPGASHSSEMCSLKLRILVKSAFPVSLCISFYQR